MVYRRCEYFQIKQEAWFEQNSYDSTWKEGWWVKVVDLEVKLRNGHVRLLACLISLEYHSCSSSQEVKQQISIKKTCDLIYNFLKSMSIRLKNKRQIILFY